MRALERCRATGRPLARLAEEFLARPAPFSEWRTKLTQLDRPPVELEQRLQARVTEMLRTGLVGEVRQLQVAGLKDNPSAASAIGYREVVAMIEGRVAEAALADEIVKNTRALVKKQRTWFRTQLPPHRILAAETATVETLFDE
jgi:tRNA dimethylallyltransferase